MMISLYVSGYGINKRKNTPSGSALLLTCKDYTRAFVLKRLEKTGNRAELLAAISGLNLLDPNQTVAIYSNLEYLVFGMTKYKDSRLNKQPHKVANLDLWIELDLAVSKHKYVHFVRPNPNDPHMFCVEERAFEAAHKIVTVL